MISIRHSVGFIKPMRTQDEILWEELARVHNWWGFQGKGDFNVTIFQSEIVGSARDKSAMWDFSYFISELNLVDLPLEGCSYMWSNNHDPRYHA